jgi:REP element-mobilizing transposase RayT
MPQARYRLIDTATTPYYHCMSRCVRRAFLCGKDKFTNRNFDHRKGWILDRVKHLSSLFAVDVCAYAIMSNHFHLVLHIDTQRAAEWTLDEVLQRWLTLYKGPPLAQRYQAGENLTEQEHQALSLLVEVWRSRLVSLSWFMGCLNENIARMANAEDECTGRFWEGRFKSQALLDEAALISCMTYVDLNPIRGGMCDSLESSDFTSIQERLLSFAANQSKRSSAKTEPWLRPLSKEGNSGSEASLPMEVTNYFALVDWTGRAVRDDKRGAIPSHIQPVLQRLGVNEHNWVINTQHFGSRFQRALGRINRIRQLAGRTDQKWIHGLTRVAEFYS